MKLLFFSGLLISLSWNNSITNDQYVTYKNEAIISDTLDVLSEVNAINNDSAFILNSSFRKGIVSNYDFKDYLTITENGYKIKLPASNNVPTPTWKDGKIYVSGGFGSKQFFSFEAETGDLNWAINLDDDGPSSCVIEDDVVVFNTESCTIFACDKNTGKHLWSYWLGDPLMSTPTIDNGMVFSSYPCGGIYSGNIYDDESSNALPAGNTVTKVVSNSAAYSHAIIAFDLKTGNILWQKRIEGDILSAPVGENGELHVVTFSGVYYVLDQKTGEFKSAKRCRATSAPVISDGRIYFSQRADKAGEKVSEMITGYNTKLDEITFQTEKKDAPYLDKNVQQSSKFKIESSGDDALNGFVSGAPASANWEVAYDNIGQSNVSSLQNFYGSRVLSYKGSQYNLMGDTLFCIDNVTGNNVWKYKVDGDLLKEGGYLATSPVVAGDHLIIATLKGEILLIDHISGKVENKYEIKEPVRSQPIVMHGWIYITTTSGYLYAINTNNITVSGWPMLGANNQHSNKVL